MKRRLSQFVAALREGGIRISTSEAIDATRAVGSIGIARDEFRDALAATLVKDEADRPVFEKTFDDFFFPPHATLRKRRRPAGGGAGGSGGAMEDGSRGSPRPRDDPSEPTQRPSAPKSEEATASRERERRSPGEGLRRQRELLDRPFRELDGIELGECVTLASHLARRFRARWRRREERTKRGRLDVRRMLRRSVARGGVPLERSFRRLRPGRPNLTALCDLSHSVASASQFLLALLHPASGLFRRVRLVGFVDTPIGIEFEQGHLRTEGPIDMMARSDFGQVLRRVCEREERHIDRNTVLLILGDARNNRRPARVDLLRRLHERPRRVVWLNPEAPSRWGSGDSVIHQYERECDVVLAASTPRQLAYALDRLRG